MRRYALVVGVVLAVGVVAAGSVLDNILFSIGPWDQVGDTQAPATGPVIHDLWKPRPDLFVSVPRVSVIRPMNVSVTPERPEPFEEVFATISGRTSDPYLTLDTATVTRQGNTVVIDLQWSTYTPPPSDFINGQCSLSTGYGVEQTRPMVSGASVEESYEVTRSLGGFEAGRYWIRVYSAGALEGEAQATFEVRQDPPTFFDLLQFGSW